MKEKKARVSKKRVLLVVTAVLVLALLGAAVTYVTASNNKATEIKADGIVTVDQGDIIATFAQSATVESGRQGSFEILDGTRVTALNVRVGDLVKQGDLLASFDTSSLNALLQAKKKDYSNAQKSYKEYLAGAAAAPKQAVALKQQIAALEKEIARLQAEEAQPKAEEVQPSGNSQLEELKTAIAGLLGNTSIANMMVDRVFAENGSVAQTLAAFQNLLSGSLGMGMDANAMASMMSGMGSLGNSELINASLQLVQLKVQETMLGLQSGASLDDVYKSLADSAEKAYRQTELAVEQLKNGWVAEADGIVREVNISAGEIYQAPEQSSGGVSSINVTTLLASISTGNADISSLLSGLFETPVKGMVVEYYPFTATFLVGKYDLAKIYLDQPAKVKSVSGKIFDATITYISPVATEGGEINISSLLGSSGSSKGVEARITIPEPDKSITIGLDVDVTIDLETKKNVVRVPVESVQYDEDSKENYVFIYEAVSKTIQKTPIETGLFDGTYYEVLQGIDAGAEIVRAPQRDMLDGDRVKIAA
ncbi:MAG: biotin/lipoyl-binding protein [Oscillospiraceae bacterium]|jgi:multidrug efflux pump subunit AcrA (membrane-fusion protein)|nr:biotin/lipoyl-binding protein [Oscillospiraceae bacterium]